MRGSTTPGALSPAASARRPATAASRSRAHTPATYLKRLRCSRSVWAMSGRSTSAPAPAIHSANTPAVAAMRAGDLPDTTNVLTGDTTPEATATDSGSGACSTITCALVPDTPNDDTPARRGRDTTGHSIACAATTNSDAPAPALGVNSEKFRCRGMNPCRTDNTVLMNPAIPEADSKCPRLVLTDPNTNGAEPPRSPHTALNASNSIGSPNAVPVPCAST